MLWQKEKRYLQEEEIRGRGVTLMVGSGILTSLKVSMWKMITGRFSSHRIIQ
jgi:hypothetical protein